jgi:hypothetical protein
MLLWFVPRTQAFVVDVMHIHPCLAIWHIIFTLILPLMHGEHPLLTSPWTSLLVGAIQGHKISLLMSCIVLRLMSSE